MEWYTVVGIETNSHHAQAKARSPVSNLTDGIALSDVHLLRRGLVSYRTYEPKSPTFAAAERVNGAAMGQ